jgi:hypothetical protein
MGDFIGAQGAAFTTGSLNWMFGTNINATFATIESLRDTFPNLLLPMQNTGPKQARKQTLRFAAFLLTDEVTFDGNYPAPHFKHWLKWLTWLGKKAGGTVTLDGADYPGKASELILDVMARALPHGGTPAPIHFSWTNDAAVAHFTVAGTTIGGFRIDIISPDHGHVAANSDDEDAV